jgi:hypothetical protein
MTVRDYDIVMLAMKFDEGIEEPTTDSFEWIRKLRSQPGFPEMIIVAEGGSELAAIRTLRLGAADYLPKRLITPQRLQRSVKLTLRAIEKEAQRRAERLALAEAAKSAGKAEARQVAPAGEPDKAATSMPAARPATLAGAASPVSTATGAGLARAAKVALTAVPTPVPAPPPAVKVETSARDPAAASLPAAAVSLPTAANSLPAPVKESKPVAPPNHQIPGYTILQKIGESPQRGAEDQQAQAPGQ